MENANPRIPPWSDLPPELLDTIAKCLTVTAAIDVSRFRGVCRSWRNSTPRYNFPTIILPFFHDRRHSVPEYSGAYFILVERIVYRIQLRDSQTPDFWLVKLENSDNCRMKIINPVTHHKIETSPAVEMPAVLNTLDFQISEVCKAYALRYVNPSRKIDSHYEYMYAKKVIFCPNAESGKYVVMIVDYLSRLLSISSNSMRWTLFHESVGNYDFAAARFYDVANLRWQFAVDGTGDIWAFEPSSHFGWRTAVYDGYRSFKRRLVLSCDGELLLVEEMRNVNGPCTHLFRVQQPVVDVSVYAPPEPEVRQQWLDIKAMRGCIIVVGDDCSYYIPAQELKGARVFYTDRYSFLEHEILAAAGEYTCFECYCKGRVCNCVNGFVTEAVDDEVANDDVRRVYEGVYGHYIGVYDSETGGTGTALTFPQYASIFWPPPAWLRRQ